MYQIPHEVNFSNPDDIIRFIVDNNPKAVKDNLSRAGLYSGGLTPCTIKDKIISLNNQGYNVRPLLAVPFNAGADNYTVDIMSEAKRMNGNQKSSFDWSDLGDIFAGLGTGIGAVLGTGPAPVVMPPPPAQNYTPFILGGVAILAAIILIVMLKK